MDSANTQIIPFSPPPPPPPPSSSSSSRSTQQFTYEVFLSFRGEDTRYGFTDHLYQALISTGIHTFRDDNELKRGGVIESEIQKAIEESKIFVIIFSANYANSRWCLDELVEISLQRQRLILPIFYHIDPSDVRKQTGSFEKAFVDQENEADEEKREKIQKWRSALKKVGNLAGYDLQKYGYETMLIKEITDVILKELNSKLSLHVSINMVGMNYHLKKLKSLMEIESNDVRMIGVYGLGGIGKTTISKVVYNNVSHLFESSIFLGNVRERFQDYKNRIKLQKELLNGAMKGKNIEINSVEEGINVIKQRLCSKKVLLILDDVDKSEQLELLVGKLGWFGPKSRIIITTRDQRMLNEHDMHASYEVKGLDYNDSIQLFCQYAFKQNVPKKDYVDLSNDMVNYANGLPLALKVLGSSLRDRSVLEWESALQKLKTKPNDEVHKVLKISFEGLDETEKEIFLDIACFFKGCNENYVTRLVEHATIGIRVLSEKNLITLLDNTIGMHDLVQEMGREIVRQKHHKEPGKWSRLWDLEDISLVLKKETGTEAIQGIFLDMSRLREMKFTTKAFRRMKGLRLLKVYWSCSLTNHIGREYPKLLVPEDFKFPSYDLRYLHWERYPLESLPSNFDGENLIELNLEHSNIKHLWKMEKLREKLQVLNLSTSQQLTYMPCFSNMPNLEQLQLTYMPCFSNIPNLEQLNIDSYGSLKKVDSSIGFLNKLTSLDLSWCLNIRSLPSSIQNLVALKSLRLDSCKNLRSLPSSICKLKCLEYLDLSCCSKLKTFPEITENMEFLKGLYLSRAGIEGLPSSIMFLNHLSSITLTGCENLRSLPSNICKLKSIGGLEFSDCLSLESFPEITEDMECLEDFDLNRTCINDITYLRLKRCENLRSLPNSICRLKSLKSLSLSGCSNLESFPEIMEDMECLKDLDLRRTGIRELPLSIGNLDHLTSLVLSHCKNLRSLPSSISRLKLLRGLYLNGCPNLVTGHMDRVTASNLWCLSSLKELDLSENNMCHIPADITQLLSLERLNISRCKMLEEILELPSSLREIYVCECPSLGTLSNPSCLLWSYLLRWFKKIEPMPYYKWKGINLGSNGIPWWVQYQAEGSQIRIELPMNWYQDDHFLGFGFFCQYRLDEHHVYIFMKFHEQYVSSDCLDLVFNWRDDKSGEVLLLYYPKILIGDKFIHSNQVSFGLNSVSTDKFKSCGVHLIYSQDYEQNHISPFDFLGTQDDEGNHMPMPLINLPENSGDSSSATIDIKRRRDDAEHNQAEQPHLKRLREPNTNLKL